MSAEKNKGEEVAKKTIEEKALYPDYNPRIPTKQLPGLALQPASVGYRFKGIYMETTGTERPLFDFLHRPWKVEDIIANGSSCDGKISKHY